MTTPRPAARWSPLAVSGFELVFRPWMRRRLRALHLTGLPESIPRDRPIVLAANHTSWWDGFVLREVQRALRPAARLYTVMRGDELRRFRVFGWMGALDVGPGSPRALLAALRFLRAERERDPSLAVAIFPQGRLWPASRRPLGFARGVATLSRLLAPATVLPVAIEYETFASPAPSAFGSVGTPIECRATLDLAALEGAVTRELEAIDAFLGAHGERAPLAWPGPAGRLPAAASAVPLPDDAGDAARVPGGGPRRLGLHRA